MKLNLRVSCLEKGPWKAYPNTIEWPQWTDTWKETNLTLQSKTNLSPNKPNGWAYPSLSMPDDNERKESSYSFTPKIPDKRPENQERSVDGETRR